MKKIRVAKGKSIPRGALSKIRDKPGSSNVGKYKNLEPSQFAGSAGGASPYSFPINSKKRAHAALSYAHNAPNPSGIKRTVYKKYPKLKSKSLKKG